MPNEPKVSVVIPTYKREKELEKSIDTVLKQDYDGEIEIIIIDDSPEYNPCPEKINSWVDKSSKRQIKYIYNGNPKGASYARNIGLKYAKGEFIAFLDDDDIWTKNKINEQVKILNHDEFKHINLCVTWILDKRFDKYRVNKTPDVVDYKYVLDAFNLQSTSAYMFRTKYLREINGFDSSLPSAQEYDLALRISKKTPIISIPKVLVIQNKTKGQISENWSRKIKGILAIRKKYKKDYTVFHHLKTIGLVFVFSLGFVFGNKIYGIITIFKERHQ